MRTQKGLLITAAVAALGSLAGCGGGGGGGDTAAAPGTGTGTLRLALTDAPACGFDQVNITVEKVRVHRSAGAGEADAGWSEIVLNPPKRIDLLALNNGLLETLGQTALPAGKYTQLRLVLADNKGNGTPANAVLPTGQSAEVALQTPSAQQSGLKMNTNIDVAGDQLADYVIDFDACKSIVTTGSGKYLLKPVVQVIPRLLNGVSGTVDSSIANGSTTVSLQKDGVVARATAPGSNGQFLLQPVEPGTYTLVLAAPGRATAVVRSVVVGTGTVSPIGSLPLAPTSSTATLTGTVSSAVTPIDATVRALQALTGGPAIEVASRTADAASGAFAFTLPLAPTQVASYASGTGTLTFSPDTGSAGKYSAHASSGTATQVVGPYTLSSGTTTTATFSFP